MAVTLRKFKIASSCLKIFTCILLFGTYYYFKRPLRTNWAGAQGNGGTAKDNDMWIKPARTANDGVGLNPEVFLVRHLLEINNNTYDNCTKRGISSFPTVFSNEQRRNGAIIINFLVAFYMCGLIGYVCAAYFVPSLEVICQDLNLSPDVAGATFMAAGSSAPEFFSAFIGTFISEDDTGISAIVGSAAFNVFIIISACCFLAGETNLQARLDVNLTWWPLFRDCVVYVISILLLVVVIYDSTVYWWEGLILAVCYLFYIVIMYFNPKLSAMAASWSNRRKTKDCETDSAALIGQNVVENGGSSYGTAETNGHVKAESNFSELSSNGTPGVTQTKVDEESQQELEVPKPFHPPDYILLKIAWVIGLPGVVLMFLTVPDCRKTKWRKYYLLTFTMSTVWLMGTSYILYWMITVLGYTLDIPDTVMGITILAAGTSVPDLVASVLVVRHGYGDMAISNIIGSNIFEVFICLGLLWFLKSVTMHNVVISSDGLTFTSITLLLTVAFIVLAIHINGWKLDTKMGIICLVVYAIFITFAILRELGLIGGVLPPDYCPGPK